MIKFVSSEDVLPLRSEYLRAGAALEHCRFEGDDATGSFHLGYFHDDRLICVASFQPNVLPEFPGSGMQLRGMVTDQAWQAKGIGNKVINFAIVYLRGQHMNYLWCNARKSACRFYSGLGFEFISAEFEIEGIGPHRKMYLKIK